MYERQKWPSYTCVACYFYNSLKSRGLDVDKAQLSKSLGIKIPNGVENPFNLESSLDKLEWGISVNGASKKINEILIDMHSDLIFRHVPLSSIPYQMYEETIEELIANNVEVGIGYDYNLIDCTVSSSKHVSFLRKGSKGFFIEDFYEKDQGESFDITLAELIRNVSKIDDGLWLIAPKEKLSSLII